jgi:hypothetical protein
MLEIANRVLLNRHRAAVAAEKFPRAQSEAVVLMPPVAASLSILVGEKVAPVRWAAATVDPAWSK